MLLSYIFLIALILPYCLTKDLVCVQFEYASDTITNLNIKTIVNVSTFEFYTVGEYGDASQKNIAISWYKNNDKKVYKFETGSSGSIAAVTAEEPRKSSVFIAWNYKDDRQSNSSFVVLKFTQTEGFTQSGYGLSQMESINDIVIADNIIYGVGVDSNTNSGVLYKFNMANNQTNKLLLKYPGMKLTLDNTKALYILSSDGNSMNLIRMVNDQIVEERLINVDGGRLLYPSLEITANYASLFVKAELNSNFPTLFALDASNFKSISQFRDVVNTVKSQSDSMMAIAGIYAIVVTQVVDTSPRLQASKFNSNAQSIGSELYDSEGKPVAVSVLNSYLTVLLQMPTKDYCYVTLSVNDISIPEDTSITFLVIIIVGGFLITLLAGVVTWLCVRLIRQKITKSPINNAASSLALNNGKSSKHASMNEISPAMMRPRTDTKSTMKTTEMMMRPRVETKGLNDQTRSIPDIILNSGNTEIVKRGGVLASHEIPSNFPSPPGTAPTTNIKSKLPARNDQQLTDPSQISLHKFRPKIETSPEIQVGSLRGNTISKRKQANDVIPASEANTISRLRKEGNTGGPGGPPPPSNPNTSLKIRKQDTVTKMRPKLETSPEIKPQKGKPDYSPYADILNSVNNPPSPISPDSNKYASIKRDGNERFQQSGGRIPSALPPPPLYPQPLIIQPNNGLPVPIASQSTHEYSFFENESQAVSGPFAPISSLSNNQLQKYSEKTNTSTTSCSDHSDFTTTFTQVHTMISNQRELAIPGFLQYKPDIDYKLRQQVARGGTATVFLAKIISQDMKARANGSPLCIAKVLNNTDPNKDEIASFSQEISIMWYFRSSRNFAKLLGFTTSPATIIMKHYQRGSLSDLIYNDVQNIAWTSHLIFCLLKDIAVGLKEMHENGFAHCDIKPGNILIEEDDNGIYAVLADFGISRIVNTTVLLVEAFEIVNIDGVSVAYSAPEVLRKIIKKSKDLESVNTDVIRAGDVYSFSMVAYEIINRQQPWPKTKSAQEVIARVLRGDRPELTAEVMEKKSIDKKLSGLCDIMQQCWVDDPMSRLQMKWIIEILEQVQNASVTRIQ